MSAPVTRRALLGALACAGLPGGNALAADSAATLHLVVPQAPGGAADFIARLISKELSRSLNRPLVIDNRSGGGTIIGTQTVALADPDGDTFGLVFSPLAINQAMRAQMPYDALTDLEPVCLGGYSIVVLVTRPDFPARDVTGMLELARQHTGQPLHYASLGIGTVSHLAGELLASETYVALEHVPYNGSAPIYQALFRGDLPLAFVTLESALPHLQAGRLQALGITSARRAAAYPQLPAIAESVPGFELLGFFGFIAPARTPAPFIDALSTAIIEALQIPSIRDRLASGGQIVSTAPPAAFTGFLRQQINKYKALADRTGITLS